MFGCLHRSLDKISREGGQEFNTELVIICGHVTSQLEGLGVKLSKLLKHHVKRPCSSWLCREIMHIHLRDEMERGKKRHVIIFWVKYHIWRFKKCCSSNDRSKAAGLGITMRRTRRKTSVPWPTHGCS